MLSGKTVMITGGTGSFGNAFVRIALEKFNPEKLIIYSRDEFKQYQMAQKFNSDKLRFFIGDVRDEKRLYRALSGGVDYVIHAAAMKQVPASEYNPFEAVQTNIMGAQNLISATLETGVKNVVALSTDKACNPVNLYGATKLCSDKLFIAANAYSGKMVTRFAVVRYGNVIGSRGSVVPLFKELAESGEIPVTDTRMTRFWITLPQAVKFVADSFQVMNGGELFIPKIPSMKLVDLARAIAPDCKIKIIGIRPGEKLHEIMISSDDARNLYELDDRYIKMPDFPFWKTVLPQGAGKVEDGFAYTSNTNEQWLDVEGLRELLHQQGVIE
ncbi:MAG: UDP-N-acetylglucosamine 4,6-dehydratase (inverting) [Candidatus Rifleibacteriota bacterium]